VVAEIAAIAVLLITAVTEWLHSRRCQVLAPLAFGPHGKPEPWAVLSPIFRAIALSALVWGLVTLVFIEAKVHQAEEATVDKERHLLLVLDVSPSMRLQDSGPTKKQSRMRRARDLMTSFFRRVPMAEYKSSVIAVYNGAKPVVAESTDLNIVRNILNDLPMHYAFKAGKTDLFAGITAAAKVAQGWRPRSATLLLITDGDTVPATGMPSLPASIGDVVVVGVGDPVTGKFIDGRQSRQDRSTLRQIAVRLNGRYHNGNEKHLSSELLGQLGRMAKPGRLEQLTLREYALLACGLAAAFLAFLPILLHYFGTRWTPGIRNSRELKEHQNVHQRAVAQ
jgi:Ca-activated chloride channel homolog